MTIDELVNECRRAIVNKLTPQSRASISIKMSENPKCPKRRRLFGRRGPYGNVVAFGFDGFDTVIFDAVEILAYLVEYGDKSEAKP